MEYQRQPRRRAAKGQGLGGGKKAEKKKKTDR